jgi:hypothetical protein
MSPSTKRHKQEPVNLEAAVDAALASCDNDPRAAIASLVIALSLTEEELQRTHQRVSKGYVRSQGRHAGRPETGWLVFASHRVGDADDLR